MRFRQFVPLFVFLIFAAPGLARAEARCSQVHHLEGRSAGLEVPMVLDQATTRDHTVEIVWYPNSRYVVASHLELAVDGTLWAADLNLTREGRLANRKLVSKMGGRGFTSFHVRVSEPELIQLNEALIKGEGLYRLRTCSSGACNFLAAHTGLHVPLPFSISPTMTAIYLSILRAAGSDRVVRIEWVGSRNWQQFLTVQPILELAAAYKSVEYGMFFVLTIVDKFGTKMKAFIPVISY